MKKSVIGSVMVAEVALMVSVMALNANSSKTGGHEMLAQANQKQVNVSTQHSDKSQNAQEDGTTYHVQVRK